MKTKIISLMVLLAIAVVSCQKDEADKPALLQDVEFGVMQVDPSQLKNDWDFACDTTLVATIAEIEIGGTTYYPQIFWLNGSLYTQAIKLAPGVHSVTKFVLWTEHPTTGVDPEIVMATPNGGAAYSEYITRPVPFDIEVSEFAKTEEEVEVLCFIPERVEEFGFFWFVIDETIIREQCFFGDLCIKSKDDYVGSYYDDLFSLEDHPFDLPALFKIKLERADGWEIEVMNFDIVDGEATNYQAPLCIKYPDRLGVSDEYTLTLYVLVAQGDGWEFVEFKTLTFFDFYIDEFLNEGEVIDFVVGFCNYDPNEDWLFPAWINLPTTASIDITQDWNYLYWKLDVQSNSPSSNNYDILNEDIYTSWCGDGEVTLQAGGPYNFNIYNTLYYDKWHLMPNATEEKMNQVHWLINNIGNYSGFAPFTGLIIPQGTLDEDDAQTLQDAIWTIINGAGAANVPFNFDPINTTEGQLAATMATHAVAQGSDFKPMPGQWSSILVIRDDNPGTHQLIFTVVDP